MKINILKQTINLDLLDETINRYECINGKDAQYIIMNNKTQQIMTKYLENENVLSFIISPYRDDYYGEYHGIPIAICNKLDIGDIKML